MKDIKIANIKTSLKNLFSRWLDITKSFHGLTNRERDVLALLLYYNHIYKEEVSNERLRWKLVFGYDTKMLIKEELRLKDSILQNTLSRLRKKNVIKSNRVISTYVPDISEDSKIFKIVFNLKIVDDE